MRNESFLSNFSPVLKLMSLVVIIIICGFVFNLLGIVIAIPFWGKEAITAITGSINFDFKEHINFFKYLQIVNEIGMFVVPSVLFAFLVSKSIGVYLKIKQLPRLYTLIAGLLVIVVSMPFISWLISINEMMHLPQALSGIEEWMRKSEDSAEVFTKAFLEGSSLQLLLLNLLMIAVLPAIGEEFLFRGVLIKIFKDWFGNPHIAIFVAAFLFSAIHMQFFGFLPRFVLGLLLGYLYYFSKNLWVPIAAHFFNNASAVIASFLYNRKIIHSDIDTLVSAKGDYLLIIVSFALTLLLMISIYKREKNTKDKEDNQVLPLE
ncbi:MAG: CPBP family intramembrane glutamic endopeptidase [Bacteroidota bacterium]